MLRKFFLIIRLKTTFYTDFKVFLHMVQSLVTLQHNISRSNELAFLAGETQASVLSFHLQLWFILWCSYRVTTLYILFLLIFSTGKMRIPRLWFTSISCRRLNIIFFLRSELLLLQLLAY